MIIKDGGDNGGIFCSTEANDQYKKECRDKLGKIPEVYSTEKSDKLRQNYKKIDTLTKFERKLARKITEIGSIVEKNPLFGGKV